ncbi:transmembrane protein, putative [Medicago truncatula]|uniref:Transmembrane protein, putative n=1 Tax=Medicago truncatula TaxID=3880 RepID=A0A072VDZ1_MEDTR|nr:transmembrane protein, putative [Medicago truncatula]
MVFHHRPFIETGLFENFQGFYEWSMGLMAIGFFFPPSYFLLPCLPSNSEATGNFIVVPYRFSMSV